MEFNVVAKYTSVALLRRKQNNQSHMQVRDKGRLSAESTLQELHRNRNAATSICGSKERCNDDRPFSAFDSSMPYANPRAC
jgi:hypothetical protein